HRIGALARHRVGFEVFIAQLAGVGIAVLGHALPGQLARGHEGQFDVRMPGHQPDQFGAGMATGTDDAQREFSFGHECESRRCCRWLRTAGHSLSMMENTTVSRGVPSAWRLWLRSTPSCFAPSRAMAVREAWLNQLVSKPTAMQPIASNACRSNSSLASVFRPVRCTRRWYQV